MPVRGTIGAPEIELRRPGRFQRGGGTIQRNANVGKSGKKNSPPTTAHADSPTDASNQRQDFSFRGRLFFGLVVVCVLVFAIGGWAATAQLASAVIAPGTIVVDRNVKKVQHLDGGIVAEILVKDGDQVGAGDVVVRLDETQTRAELGVIRAEMLELAARRVRLRAERNSHKEIKFPADLSKLGQNAQQVIGEETRLFHANRETREGQKAQLQSRIEQLGQEINGLVSQRDAKAQELALIRKELVQVEKLYEKQLTTVSRVYNMQREATRISGEHGGLVAQIARANGNISEIKLQIISTDQTARTDAQRELSGIDARLAALAERRVATRDKLNRVNLRAPLSGIVHELAVHTVGGVISPADTVMLIVPEKDELIIEVKAAPVDIDQVRLGQITNLRFSAFNQRTTPELDGQVVRIAADLSHDPNSGLSYYVVRIQIDDEARAKLGGLKLIPGMPVEAFIQTGERTAVSYFLKPFTDQLARAFREE